MIIVPNDIRDVRPIADNVNDLKRIVPYIEECEKLYVMPAIGAKQYLAIETAIANSIKETASVPLSDELKNLLNGCYYDSDNQHCEGLKKAMGYLAYSRIARNGSANVTAFGLVQKTGQFSEALDEKAIVRIANDAEKIGLEYLKQCVDYLNFGKQKEDKRIFKGKTKFKAIGD
ncbi:MAG: hypothetical protein WCH34_16410 [Bacteroidota bacterium]